MWIFLVDFMDYLFMDYFKKIKRLNNSLVSSNTGEETITAHSTFYVNGSHKTTSSGKASTTIASVFSEVTTVKRIDFWNDNLN